MYISQPYGEADALISKGIHQNDAAIPFPILKVTKVDVHLCLPNCHNVGRLDCYQVKLVCLLLCSDTVLACCVRVLILLTLLNKLITFAVA